MTYSFYSDCYSGNNCSGFFDVLNEQSAECHYCESYSILKDPVSVSNLENGVDCVGPVANGTCPSNTSVVSWEILANCSVHNNSCTPPDFYESIAADTSESCAYCIATDPGSSAPCYENIPANQTCTDIAAVAPAVSCAEYDPSNPLCPSALENLTESCAECFAYEDIVEGSAGAGPFET